MGRPLIALPLVLISFVGIPVSLVRAEPPTLLAQATASLQTVNPGDQTLYLNNDDTHDYNLRVTANTTISGLAIPAGAIVRGRFEPVEGGLRYVADSVEFNSRVYGIRAISDTFHDVKDPRETTAGAILGDAAIGAAGGALLTEIFGDASVGGAIGGAAAGVVVGNVTAQRVVVIEPNQAIALTPRLL